MDRQNGGLSPIVNGCTKVKLTKWTCSPYLLSLHKKKAEVKTLTCIQKDLNKINGLKGMTNLGKYIKMRKLKKREAIKMNGIKSEKVKKNKWTERNDKP